MKVKIWQQFSSNHSSEFTVVGEFPSREDAERAATEIKTILKRIADWRTAHTDDFRDYVDDENEPTPIELEIAAEYGVEWPDAVDWAQEHEIDIVLDRLLFLKPTARPASAGEPFDQIMTKLGGKGYLEGDAFGDTVGMVIFDLTCTAPDEQTAQSFVDRYHAFERFVKCDGRKLHFDRWRLQEHIRFDQQFHFATLVNVLTDAGCTDIAYTFTSLHIDKPDLYHKDDVDRLIEQLKNPPDTYERDDVVEALGNIGDTRAVEPLIALLDTDSLILKYLLIAALAKLDDTRSHNALINLLEEDQYWDTVANCLVQIGEKVRQSVQDWGSTRDEKLRQRAESVLRRIDAVSSGGGLLAGMFSQYEADRWSAFEQVKQQRNYVDILLAYLQNPDRPMDARLENAIVETLIASGDERVLQGILSTSITIGRRAIIALAQIGEPAVDTLLGLHRSHREEQIRDAALHALARIGDNRVYADFVQALKDPYPFTVRIAANGLAKIGDVRAIEPLREALARAENDIEKKAIQQALDKLS